MDRYCLNRNQQVGHGYNHEVHKSWCSRRPLPSNQIDPGYCYSDEEALKKSQTVLFGRRWLRLLLPLNP